MKEEQKEIGESVSKGNNNLDEKLVAAYVGPKYEKLKNKHFSFSSLFFGWEYLAYRKFYNLLSIFVVINWVLSAISSAIPEETLMVKFIVIVFLDLLPLFILALIFNKLYLNDVKRKVNKIKDANPNASENELINICSKKGGVSVISIILATFIIIIIRFIINVIIKAI